MGKLSDNLWRLYNEYCVKGVMIISRADFERETERICIQNKCVNCTKDDEVNK